MKLVLKGKWDVLLKSTTPQRIMLPSRICFIRFNTTFKNYLQSYLLSLHNLHMHAANQKKNLCYTTSNGKLFILHPLNIGQMTLPTVKFFANRNRMERTFKTCGRGASFLINYLHSFLTILAPTLFHLQMPSIRACSNFISTH